MFETLTSDLLDLSVAVKGRKASAFAMLVVCCSCCCCCSGFNGGDD
jgi:hypothetical protein